MDKPQTKETLTILDEEYATVCIEQIQTNNRTTYFLGVSHPDAMSVKSIIEISEKAYKELAKTVQAPF